jgi:transcription initiation factor TFIID subunit 12
VDQVITAACRLAKIRGSAQLEVRDLQTILERNYNIRVPGFAIDDIRVHKKNAPTAAYLQKMSAVQAAKVTGGKADL